MRPSLTRQLFPAPQPVLEQHVYGQSLGLITSYLIVGISSNSAYLLGGISIPTHLLRLLQILRPHLPLPQLRRAGDDLAQITDWQVEWEVDRGEHEG